MDSFRTLGASATLTTPTTTRCLRTRRRRPLPRRGAGLGAGLGGGVRGLGRRAAADRLAHRDRRARSAHSPPDSGTSKLLHSPHGNIHRARDPSPGWVSSNMASSNIAGWPLSLRSDMPLLLSLAGVQGVGRHGSGGYSSPKVHRRSRASTWAQAAPSSRAARDAGPRAALVGFGATTPDARHDHANRARHRCPPPPNRSPVHRWESTYGVAVKPSNSTGRNGSPGGDSGSVGFSSDRIRTVIAAFFPFAFGSASSTSKFHTGSPCPCPAPARRTPPRTSQSPEPPPPRSQRTRTTRTRTPGSA